MMRVLYVTVRFPGCGLRGDQARAFHQLRRLTPRHAITLLTCAQPEPGLTGCLEIRRSCERVLVVPRRRLHAALAVAAALPGSLPLQAALYSGWPGDEVLDELRATGNFDLAHLQLARLGTLLPRLEPLPCVLDLVDALSLNMARRAAFDRGPAGRVAAIEARRLGPFERALCRQAAAVAISSPVDREAIASERPLHLVPNGVELERFPFVEGTRSNRIVFAGNLGYFPNVDAATWFASKVLAPVRARVPDAELVLLGVHPAPALQRLAATTPGVRLVGQVPDMHPHLATAGVAVSPLRAGSGQQLKLLEAMAAGAPTVATARSADALEAVPNRHLLVADSPERMAAAVVHLLTDRARAADIARAARALVESRYTWAHAADTVDALWAYAAGRTPP